MAYESLRAILESRGKTQAEFAKVVLGRTPAVATNVFDGTRPLKLEEAQKAAEWLDVPLDYITACDPFILENDETDQESPQYNDEAMDCAMEAMQKVLNKQNYQHSDKIRKAFRAELYRIALKQVESDHAPKIDEATAESIFKLLQR